MDRTSGLLGDKRFSLMKTLWINSAAIEDIWIVNNQKENPGYIESLTESIRQNGYLPEYPIISFETDNIRLRPTSLILQVIS